MLIYCHYRALRSFIKFFILSSVFAGLVKAISFDDCLLPVANERQVRDTAGKTCQMRDACRLVRRRPAPVATNDDQADYSGSGDGAVALDSFDLGYDVSDFVRQISADNQTYETFSAEMCACPDGSECPNGTASVENDDAEKTIALEKDLFLKFCRPIRDIMKTCADFRRPVVRLFRKVSVGKSGDDVREEVESYVKVQTWCSCPSGHYAKSTKQDFWMNTNQLVSAYKCNFFK
uniref:Spaetzle domain-containing protein n=1 Tax=Romanomermis culicivorax TaxID=13658 RepID=A0A915LC75_ROMCU